MPCKVQDEITYPFPNFIHSQTLGMDKKFHLHFIVVVITYPCW